MKTISSEKVRHLLLQGSPGDALPDAVLTAFREHQAARVWLRGGGVLSEVTLRTRAAEEGAPDVIRRIAGPLELLLLEGSLGIASGDSLSLRAVLARETDRGLDTLAGEIVSARIVRFEAVATALDGDAAAESSTPYAEAPDAPPQPRRITTEPSSPAPAWSEAIAASPSPRESVTSSPPVASAPIPPRPVRPTSEIDVVFPEAGDVVDHFAFGRCEVIKSDGDRLHLRGKDGRIREIALEMLRVHPLPPEGDTRRFRLDRKL